MQIRAEEPAPSGNPERPQAVSGPEYGLRLSFNHL